MNHVVYILLPYKQKNKANIHVYINLTKKMKRKNTFSKQFWIYTAIYIAVCVVIFGLPALLTSGSILDFTQTGQIGDTIGGIMGPFVAMIAAYLTFIAFWVQKQANDAQRQDIKVERFNSNFYNLLNIHEQITSSLEYNTYKYLNNGWVPTKYRGREVFFQTFEVIPEDDKDNRTIGDGMRGRIKAMGVNSYEGSKLPTYFDHYFRNLYRIVKYIDETDVFDADKISTDAFQKKKEYIAILRSTLSRYELVWLFYNTLSEYGRAKFKPLVEKYALLNNIRVDLLVNPQDVYLFDAGAFGGAYPEI